MSDRVIRNDAEGRYELDLGAGLAVAYFERREDRVLFTHTEVPPAARGQGAASKLIAGALADVRAQGLQAVPLCSFVRRYMEDHPDTAAPR
jgi:uncharacterized protein